MGRDAWKVARSCLCFLVALFKSCFVPDGTAQQSNIMSLSNPSIEDVEKGGADYAYLTNTTVRSYSWQDVIVTVKDRKTKQPLEILSGGNGIVEAGR